MLIQVKRGTEQALSFSEITPSKGEPVLSSDVNKVKFGDGVTPWDDLPYLVATPDKKFRVNLTSADSPVTLTDAHNYMYAVDLRTGNVSITLPKVTPTQEGVSCRIYIQHAYASCTLTIYAASGDLIRGSSSIELWVANDSVNLCAHNYGTPHWDAPTDARVDTIAYQPFDNNATSIQTLQQLLDLNLSSGWVSGCVITDNGNGSISVAPGEWKLRNQVLDSSECKTCSIPGATFTLTEGVSSYLKVEYNSGSPRFVVESELLSTSCTDVGVQAIMYRLGNTVRYFVTGKYHIDFMAKYVKSTAITAWLKYGQGLMLSSPAGRKISVTSGILFQGTNMLTIEATDTSVADTVTLWRRNGSGGWIQETGETAVGNNQYDTGTGSLVDISKKHYVCWWVYVLTGSPKATMVVYPQVQHKDLVDAQAEGIPSVLPTWAQSLSIGRCVGKIIVKKGGDDAEEAKSAFAEAFTSATPTDHGDLANLDAPGNHSSFIPLADSTAAFEFNNAVGTNILTIDTTNSKVIANKYLSISANTAPTVVTGTMYNVGGDLYWNGRKIVTEAV